MQIKNKMFDPSCRTMLINEHLKSETMKKLNVLLAEFAPGCLHVL
jgi:hypothetical protein